MEDEQGYPPGNLHVHVTSEMSGMFLWTCDTSNRPTDACDTKADQWSGNTYSSPGGIGIWDISFTASGKSMKNLRDNGFFPGI